MTPHGENQTNPMLPVCHGYEAKAEVLEVKSAGKSRMDGRERL